MNLDTTLRKSYDSQSLIMRTLFALDPDTNMPISTNYIVSTDGLGGVTWMNPFTNLSTAGVGVGYLPSTLYDIQTSIINISSGGTGGVLDFEIASTLQYSPYFSSVKLGYFAASTNQGLSAVAIGETAGQWQQTSYAVAVGLLAGNSYQGMAAVAIGVEAGVYNQAGSAVALGQTSGFSNQGEASVAVGYLAGRYGQGNFSVAEGFQAGYSNQGTNSVAIGTASANDAQGNDAIAIGTFAASTLQGEYSIAIGYNTALSNQGSQAISIGYQAGAVNQSTNSISLGFRSGYSNQRVNSLAIGYQAGYSNQGANSIAIGYNAGYTNQAPSSIVLSALVSTLNVRDKGFYVAPLREIQTTYTHNVGYNSNSAEIGLVGKNVMNLVVSSVGGSGDIQLFPEDNGKFFYYTTSLNNTVKMPSASNGWNVYMSLKSSAANPFTLDTTSGDSLVQGAKGYLASDGASFYFI